MAHPPEEGNDDSQSDEENLDDDMLVFERSDSTLPDSNDRREDSGIMYDVDEPVPPPRKKDYVEITRTNRYRENEITTPGAYGGAYIHNGKQDPVSWTADVEPASLTNPFIELTPPETTTESSITAASSPPAPSSTAASSARAETSRTRLTAAQRKAAAKSKHANLVSAFRNTVLLLRDAHALPLCGPRNTFEGLHVGKSLYLQAANVLADVIPKLKKEPRLLLKVHYKQRKKTRRDIFGRIFGGLRDLLEEANGMRMVQGRPMGAGRYERKLYARIWDMQGELKEVLAKFLT